MTPPRAPGAIILGLALVLGAPLTPAARAQIAPTRALDRPVPVVLRFALPGREPIRAEITQWSLDRVWVAPPGAARADARLIGWDEVDAAQAFDILRRIMPRDDAGARLGLGARMLRRGEPALANRALADALRLDPSLQGAVDRVRAAAESGADPVGAIEEPAPPAPAPHEIGPPAEGEPADPHPAGPADPGSEPSTERWPAETDEEQAAAAEEQRAEGQRMLDEFGQRTTLFETQNFLLFADLPAREAERWAAQLDAMYATLLSTLEIPEGTRLFRGKCLVFIFRDRARYEAFSQEAFGFDAANAAGFFSPKGRVCRVVFFKPGDEQRFASTLVHEAVHAFIYRYRSPAWLPTWANEGLADYVAGHLVLKSHEPPTHWQIARNFVAARGSVLEIMSQSYRDGSWPSEQSYPVSHMLVRFMLKHRAPQFKQWIDDIKDGKGWREAMLARFGVTPEALAEGFADDIRAEPGYTRLP